jgi:hypothetical protein
MQVGQSFNHSDGTARIVPRMKHRISLPYGHPVRLFQDKILKLGRGPGKPAKPAQDGVFSLSHGRQIFPSKGPSYLAQRPRPSKTAFPQNPGSCIPRVRKRTSPGQTGAQPVSMTDAGQMKARSGAPDRQISQGGMLLWG